LLGASSCNFLALEEEGVGPRDPGSRSGRETLIFGWKMMGKKHKDK
jgi:hypothetical protein